VQGLIAPGHVCAVMGWREYEDLASEFRLPVVIGGFEPIDLLEAIRMLAGQLEDGRAEVENQYVRSVTREGNQAAQRIMERVFEVCDQKWRGIGRIPASGYPHSRGAGGLRRRPHLRHPGISAEEPKECISALVLQGLKKPADCAAFGARCTPETAAGRAHGIERRRVRGVLQLPPARAGGSGMNTFVARRP